MNGKKMERGRLCELAENPSASADKLRPLAKNKYWLIRYKVASHPNCPPDCLEELSRDENSDVRCAVAEKTKLPEIAAKLLKNDECWLVRAKAAENPNIPMGALKEAIKEEKQHPSVLYAIARNAILEGISIKALIKTKNPLVLLGLAENAHTPENFLRKLFNESGKGRKEILRALASNPSAPEEVLHNLSENKDTQTRLNVLNNPKTPKDIIEKIKMEEKPRQP